MNRKTIPKFKSESAEFEFWSSHDSADLIDWKKGQVAAFPKLKPSTETISLRLPKSFLQALKIEANKRDVPYQSLMKIFLAERLEQERDRTAKRHLAKERKKA